MTVFFMIETSNACPSPVAGGTAVATRENDRMFSKGRDTWRQVYGLVRGLFS